jgi:hypothetical protein
MSDQLSDQRDELNSEEKLQRRIDATRDDGLVEVEILDWTEEDDQVTVDYLTPSNDEKTDTMPFPQAGNKLEQYRFYQLLAMHDLEMRGANRLDGKIVPATVNHDSYHEEWELCPDVDQQTTIRGRLAHWYERQDLATIASTAFDVLMAGFWLATLVVLLLGAIVLVI